MSIISQPIMRKSISLGAKIGGISGALIGALLGGLTGSFSGILSGLLIGFVPAAVTGALTAALTVKVAGTTGGIGVGYFTGMLFGALFGMLLGILIPVAWWTEILATALPILEGLVVSRFETVMHVSFLFAVLAAIVGVWIGGKNMIEESQPITWHERIDQYDLVEVVQVPEQYQNIINVGDVGVVLEIDDNDSFEIECRWPDGSYKWLETLHSRYIRLKQKIPDNI